jgi:flagellar biosynthesis/type III secretory pathway M-ring protein FliF/YscJ
LSNGNENRILNEQDLPTVISSGEGKFNQKINNIKTKISELKFIKSDTPIPILTSIIRFLIISVIGLLILFPLVCILHFKEIEELNQSKRESYIKHYIKDTEESLEMKTAYLKNEIQKTQNEINQQKGLFKDKTAQLNLLNQRLSEIIEKHNEEAEANLNAYREDIGNRYFIVHSFKAVTKYPGFLLLTILVAWVLISPHFILYRLKTNKKYIYADLSTKYYKLQIEEKYQESQKYILKFLQEKFQYTPPDGYETVIWANPPYCTQKSQKFKVRNKLNKDELITSLIKPSI